MIKIICIDLVGRIDGFIFRFRLYSQLRCNNSKLIVELSYMIKT